MFVQVQYGENPHAENLSVVRSKGKDGHGHGGSSGSGSGYKGGADKDISVSVEDLEKDFLSTAYVKSSQALKMDDEQSDPPHLRLVLILQIDSIKLSLPLDMYAYIYMYANMYVCMWKILMVCTYMRTVLDRRC